MFVIILRMCVFMIVIFITGNGQLIAQDKASTLTLELKEDESRKSDRYLHRFQHEIVDVLSNLDPSPTNGKECETAVRDDLLRIIKRYSPRLRPEKGFRKYVSDDKAFVLVISANGDDASRYGESAEASDDDARIVMAVAGDGLPYVVNKYNVGRGGHSFAMAKKGIAIALGGRGGVGGGAAGVAGGRGGIGSIVLDGEAGAMIAGVGGQGGEKTDLPGGSDHGISNAKAILDAVKTSTARTPNDLVGQWVFPVNKGIIMLGRDEKPLMKWSATAARVTWVGKDFIAIRHTQYPGPYSGYVKKSEVVVLADATKYFTDMVDRNGEDTWALSRRGDVCVKRKEPDKAIVDFTKVIQLDPSPNVYIQRGKAWGSKKEYNKALKDLDEAVKLDPNYACTYAARGDVWDDRNDADKAISDYGKALQLDPSYTYALISRGSSWLDKIEFDNAFKDFNEAIRLNPEDSDAFLNRGRAWLGKQEYEKAIRDFDMVIRLDIESAAAYQSRGYARVLKKEYDKALMDYDEAILLNPKNASIFSNRGLTWIEKQNYDRAIEDFTEALRLDRKLGSAYYGRGVAYADKREYEKSREDLLEAIKVDPKDPDARGVLAWLLATCPSEKLRDGKLAVELAKKACELSGWKQLRLIDTLAMAYAEAGDFEKAVEFQKRAIDESKSDVQRRDLDRRRELLRLFEQKKPFHEPH